MHAVCSPPPPALLLYPWLERVVYCSLFSHIIITFSFSVLPPSQQLTQYDPELAQKVVPQSPRLSVPDEPAPASPTSSRSSVSTAEDSPRSPKSQQRGSQHYTPAAAPTAAAATVHTMGQATPVRQTEQQQQRAVARDDVDSRRVSGGASYSPHAQQRQVQPQQKAAAGMY